MALTITYRKLDGTTGTYEFCSYTRRNSVQRSTVTNYRSGSSPARLTTSVYKTVLTSYFDADTGFLSDSDALAFTQVLESPYILLTADLDFTNAPATVENSEARFMTNVRDGVVAYSITFKISTPQVIY